MKSETMYLYKDNNRYYWSILAKAEPNEVDNLLTDVTVRIFNSDYGYIHEAKNYPQNLVWRGYFVLEDGVSLTLLRILEEFSCHCSYLILGMSKYAKQANLQISSTVFDSDLPFG